MSYQSLVQSSEGYQRCPRYIQPDREGLIGTCNWEQVRIMYSKLGNGNMDEGLTKLDSEKGSTTVVGHTS